jgi:membrane protein YdbS with pleckstrin-like domain
MEEANAFLADNEAFSKKIAIGVFLCVLCPVPLLLLLAYSETDLMITIGVAALFALVAAALVFIIPAGIGHSRWSWIKEELFDTEYGVDGMVRERKERFQGTFVTAITTGVVLILVGVITLVLGSMLTGKDSVAVALAGVLLVFVAVSVFLFVRTGIVKDGFSQLLREGDYSRKKEKKILDVVAPVYWLSVTAAFLAWSFIGNAWNISWMIWPVAAIVFAIIATICNSMNNRS